MVCSIRRDGLINPVVVKKLADGTYDLISGQRRYRAHEILNKSTIDAYVVDADVDEFDAKRLSLVENAARKDMKRADYVDTIQMFMNRYNSTKVVAEELGLSIPTVRKYLTIGRLPKDVQSEVANGAVTADNAIRALDALGGDETTVDQQTLLETAKEMQALSPVYRTKFTSIIKNKPEMSVQAAAKKAKQRTTTTVNIEITDDQLIRVDKFRNQKNIKDREDAAIELIEIGLDAADA